MSERCARYVSISVRVATEESPSPMTWAAHADAESLRDTLCARLKVSPLAAHLFALRKPSSDAFLPPNALVEEGNELELRMRFKVPSLARLKRLDPAAYHYYFHQARKDVLNNDVPEIIYSKHREELLGLGITDMYRVMIQDGKTSQNLIKDYKKYIPKEVTKKHSIFTKKPIYSTLERLQRNKRITPDYVIEQYLEQLESLAPNYLSEEYAVQIQKENMGFDVKLFVMPFHAEQPGLRTFVEKRKEWNHLCTIEELCFMSTRKDNNTIEISRKNGIPIYIMFFSTCHMYSFISLCDGYYRLMIKWTFNICRDLTSPHLQYLHSIKCHGPIGGEFSYHKLEEKRSNKPGCFILRQCDIQYNIYYIDVCTKNSSKPKTYKITKENDEYIIVINGDEFKYKSITELIISIKNPDGPLLLQECLLPSDYEKSQLLLCEPSGHNMASNINREDIDNLLTVKRGPLCINFKDVLKYEGPWCFVERDVYNYFYQKDYCDVSFCSDIVDCIVFSSTWKKHFYTHFIRSNIIENNLTFAIKLWNNDTVSSVGNIILRNSPLMFSSDNNVRERNEMKLTITNTSFSISNGKIFCYHKIYPTLLNEIDFVYFYIFWLKEYIHFGFPCVPWIDTRISNISYNLSIDIPNHETHNYCLYLNNENQPSCFVETSDKKVKKVFCDPLNDCKLTGIGTDYNGNYNISRSNRQCRLWNEVLTERELQNITKKEIKALEKNFCRNPIKNIAGLWCFTMDKNIKYDMCDVSDCYKSRESIIIITPGSKSSLIYIYPEWKTSDGLYFSIKSWDPSLQNAVIINIFNTSQIEYYSLTINVDGYIILKYENSSNTNNYILHRHRITRNMLLNKWFDFWIKMSDIKISLGFIDDRNPLFEWIIRENLYFKPTFLTFESFYNNPLGLHFEKMECFIENTTEGHIKKFLPIEFGLPKNLMDKNLTLNFRGEGLVIVSLFLLPGSKIENASKISCFYKARWHIAEGKRMDVAMKMLNRNASDAYLKSFVSLAGEWAFLKSPHLIRLYGIILRSPVAMIMEYMQLGSLDIYLRNKRIEIRPEELMQAAASLASALWYLAEHGIVHGKIRCYKLLVVAHDESQLTVKLSDGGVKITPTNQEIHWTPLEYFNNMKMSYMFLSTDIWALATTLWEIFSYGESPIYIDNPLSIQDYISGKRLDKPPNCPIEIYQIMRSCWLADPHSRCRPQFIMRDINQLYYQVYNSRFVHSYATVTPKSPVLKSQEDFRSIASETDDTLSLCTSGQTSITDDGTLDDNFDFDLIGRDILRAQSENLQSIFEFGDYNVVLQGIIGKGFYGIVFKGSLQKEGENESRLVAVKKLIPNAGGSQLDDFSREIEIAKTLKHEKIVEILGVVEEPEILLIMEYVEHSSLKSYLHMHQSRVTINQLVNYACDVAEGMVYLENENIVHRDLAARNILVVNEQHVKISDFGLARIIDKGGYYTLKSDNALPLAWYAPESKTYGKFSSKSDVWSYGITLWEMFSFGMEPPNWDPSWSEEKVTSLLPCPNFCPNEVYMSLMTTCWKFKPSDRPTFTELLHSCKNIGCSFET